ncbi:MAG: 5'-nucleotidase [Natrialbaceae archaeon]|jgi:5'-nucleotidase
MDRPEILLTNDDGIGSVGLQALQASLADVADVTVVAPAEDKSAIGRAISSEVRIEKHDLGYAIEGTPTDCVVAGIEGLDLDPDLVVAGINEGANIGAYVLGRSGTVSAAVEAAFFGIPAIATSLYVDVEDEAVRDIDLTIEDFAEAIRATTYLVQHAPEAGVFEHADYLNINASRPGEEPAEMVVTTPSRAYDMGAVRNGDAITLEDNMWARMASGDIPDDTGVDRRAVVEGTVSVSPLTAPHTTEHHEALDALATTFSESAPK